MAGPIAEIIVGAACLIVGVGLLRYVYSRGRDSVGTMGCLSWVLPVFGAYFLVKGGFDIAVALSP